MDPLECLDERDECCTLAKQKVNHIVLIIEKALTDKSKRASVKSDVLIQVRKLVADVGDCCYNPGRVPELNPQ